MGRLDTLNKDLIVKIVSHMMDYYINFDFKLNFTDYFDFEYDLLYISYLAMTCKRMLFLLDYKYIYIDENEYGRMYSTHILKRDNDMSFIQEGINLFCTFDNIFSHFGENNPRKQFYYKAQSLIDKYGVIFTSYFFFKNNKYDDFFSFYEKIVPPPICSIINGIRTSDDDNDYCLEYCRLVCELSEHLLTKELNNIVKYILTNDCKYLVYKNREEYPLY